MHNEKYLHIQLGEPYPLKKLINNRKNFICPIDAQGTPYTEGTLGTSDIYFFKEALMLKMIKKHRIDIVMLFLR